MKKTSAEWVKEYEVQFQDYSGWPKQNFRYHFYIEKISQSEFEERLLNSVALKDGSIIINYKQNKNG